MDSYLSEKGSAKFRWMLRRAQRSELQVEKRRRSFNQSQGLLIFADTGCAFCEAQGNKVDSSCHPVLMVLHLLKSSGKSK